MIADLGLIILALALLSTLYAVLAALYGARAQRGVWVESARRATLAVAPLLTVACALIVISNLNNNFNLEYTWQVSNRSTPAILKITSLWGSQNGSLLLFATLMSWYIFFLFVREWRGNLTIQPWVLVVAMSAQLFFVFISLFYANPFARYWVDVAGNINPAVFQPLGTQPFTPADGQGLNPLLRHPGMIIHPPMLYLGFVGLTVPFAFGIASLLGGSTASDASWIKATRRWTLVAWLFLGAGLLLGGRWAYDVLGWGGYWGWDAVENSALLPWLTATAFLHSVMIQEKRGMFKVWNMFLIIVTFCLMVIGTFATRTGVIASVHAFARSNLGLPFLSFVGVVLIGSFLLLVWRWNLLKGENQLQSIWSRESAFVLNNVLFLTITFTVFLGTWFSLFSELLIGEQLTVGPAVYNRLIGPQLVLLVLLMGIGPLLAWRKSSPQALGRMTWRSGLIAIVLVVVLFVAGMRELGALAGLGVIAYAGLITLEEFYRGARARMKIGGESLFTALSRLLARNRQRYGGYVVHLGVIIMGVGIVGTMMYQQETQRSLRPGESLQVGDYTITYQSSEIYVPPSEPDKTIFLGNVLVSSNGGAPELMRPYREVFQNGGLLPPALRTTLTEDLYVLFLGEESGFGILKVYVNPLQGWVWTGGLILIIGTLLAMWPGRVPSMARVPARRERMVASEVGQ